MMSINAVAPVRTLPRHRPRVWRASPDVARRAREVDVDGGDVADALARHRAGVAD